jgi:anti-anti-sigma regulatory factor
MKCALTEPPQRYGRCAAAHAVDGLRIESTYLARDVVCLDVSGEVDVASSATVDSAIRNAVAVLGVKRVLVDLSKGAIPRCAGIHTLVKNHNRAGDNTSSSTC